MSEIGQGVHRDPPLPDQSVGDRLSSEIAELLQEGVGIPDSDRGRPDHCRNVELLLQPGRRCASFVPVQGEGCAGIGGVHEILHGGFAVGHMVAAGHHRGIESLDLEQDVRLNVHLSQQVLQRGDIAWVDPTGDQVDLAVWFSLLGKMLDHFGDRQVVAADHAADEARGVNRNEVDVPTGELLLQQGLFQHVDAAVDVIADHLGGAGGNDRNHSDIRIPGEQHIDCFLHPVQRSEDRPVLVERGGGDFEALLEVLGEQEAHEHRATLATVHDRNAVLDADSGVLGASRLTGENGIDRPGALFFIQVARVHGVFLISSRVARG